VTRTGGGKKNSLTKHAPGEGGVNEGESSRLRAEKIQILVYDVRGTKKG